jgi:hypothetical protein
MDPLILLRITSLHARTGGSFKIKIGGKEIESGPIAACLDVSAPIPANLGLLDLATRMISLRWSVTVGLPFLADVFASLPADLSESVRMSFEETGQVHEDGSGFDAYGTGEVAPGSLFSDAFVPFQSNFIIISPKRSLRSTGRALAAGTPIRCVFRPESFLDIVLPDSLGGGTHRLSLAGGFVLTPVMTLPRTMKGVRKRR